ncbi:putative dual specificity protein phosphatase [Leptomonas pyrrhocoris]|uniref:Putative dual specificity protein phosphatase n=1 Tax=Leptomonas pyrrhocoris TaxID=157538 RepID=A0A0M9G7W1_LEPPY|nr:putative dual specificity protein phosphatase [Leptomonas pyrrhocoris]XP_015662665.1 putative dual specificity protein phosphatase [Leptomonas pyrrhocoris]KPA84225.1 putative dual specificity protein phosphatase [Leptomonas pyrrhocoris]KPA84226.1 putative dual specificity protein phosphatase [Leptomonas pyrrhocoris]|eukprot:XP_015662664.1 putative dual specificity protein phosphatase [Leptomonas pyrrhocoris]
MSQPKAACVSRCGLTYRPKADVAVVDVNTFFRILRFISANPQLATLTVATEQTSIAESTQQGLAPSSATEVTPASLTTAKPSLMGTSAAVGNRIRIPAVLHEPLENYRRMATTSPIDQNGLAMARQRVQSLLEELCNELKDADATTALCSDVFAHTEDDMVESDSTTFMHSTTTTTFGPKQNVAKTNVSNSNEMQQIVPGLWCGSWHQASNLALLEHYGITHVCCCIDTKPFFPTNFMYFQIPAADTPTYRMQPHFAQAFEFIENALVRSHGNVLVHCGAGISRAPTIVASYLMKKLHISSTAAIQLVQHHRYAASPNVGFREQLHLYGKSLQVDEVSASERGKLTNEGFMQAAAAVNSK